MARRNDSGFRDTDTDRRDAYIPGEAEIAARAAEIRAGWSQRELLKRAGFVAPDALEIQEIFTSDLERVE